MPVKDPAIPGIEMVANSISFPVQLKEGVEASVVGFEEGEKENNEKLPEENGEKLCTGNYKEPKAAPGRLCMFVGNIKPENVFEGGLAIFPQSLETGTNFSASRTGALVEVFAETKGESIFAAGTWAVTAK
jgi:hypothetical protein